MNPPPPPPPPFPPPPPPPPFFCFIYFCFCKVYFFLFFFLFKFPYRLGGGVCCMQKFFLKKRPVIYSRAQCIRVSYISIFRKYSTCNYILLVFILFAVNVKYIVTASSHLITLHSLVIKPRI